MTTRTSRVLGPWTPSTRFNSMSDVAEGPEIQVIGRSDRPADSCKARTASGTIPTI